MKAAKSKYFTQILQICVFFKYHCKPWQSQIDQSIKLMSVQQLYLNISHTQFQTKLIKQIIMFLVSKVHNPKFLKSRFGGSSHYLIGDLLAFKQQIIQHYYMQMALQQYFCLACEENESFSEEQYKRYTKHFQFCKIPQKLKYDVLSALVKNVTKYAFPQAIKSKKQIQNLQSDQSKLKQNQDKKNSNQSKSKMGKIEEMLVLGQDHQYLYLYASFIPDYVLISQNQSWKLIDRNQVIDLIRELMDRPRNIGELHLMENLAFVQQNFMKSPNQANIPIRLHKVKQSVAQMQKRRVQILSKKLLNINQRYSDYLTDFKHRCWGYLRYRQKYVSQLKKAQKLEDILKAFIQFFKISRSKIFVIQCENEKTISQEKQEELYIAQNRPFCNIHTVPNKIQQEKGGLIVKAEQISSKIIKQNTTDIYVLLQINVLLLQISVTHLQKKQQRYHQRQQAMRENAKISQTSQQNPVKNNKKILRSRQQSRNSISSLSSFDIKQSMQNKQKLNMNLRDRKRGRSKKFGVTMIDSDQSQQDSSQYKKSTDFYNYEYKTRSTKNKCQ